MQSTQFRHLSFLVFTFLFSRFAEASAVITSEYELRIPRPFQQTLIEESWKKLQREQFNLSWQIGDQSYDTPEVKVLLSGVTLVLMTKLEKPKIANDGPALILQSRDLQADLSIASIVVDQYIERDVGGVIGRFRIQARCDNVRLHLQRGQGALALKLSPEFSGSLVKSHVEDAAVTWTPSAWTHDKLQCSGADGFEDVVEKEISKQTGDAARITSDKVSMISFLQKELDQKALDLSQPRILNTGRPDIRATLTVDQFIGVADGALAQGNVMVEFLNATSRKNQQLKLSAGSANCANCKNAQLRVPESFITAVVAHSLAAGSWSTSYPSTEIPGFNRLMKSRFSQALAWPALLKFLNDDVFMFKLSSKKDLELSGKNLNYNFRAELGAAMQAPEGGRHVPFMNFVIPFSGSLSLSAADGILHGQFLTLDMNIQAAWQESYLKDHNVGQKFAATKIADKVKEALLTQSLSYEIPKIPLGGSMSLKMQEIKPLKNSTDVAVTLKL
jgi:hypothetical protein